jgi:hypothetical protein
MNGLSMMTPPHTTTVSIQKAGLQSVLSWKMIACHHSKVLRQTTPGQAAGRWALKPVI